MKSFKDIFTEYQDPKVIRNFKWGFALLIVLGVLITFVAAPPLRHLIIPEHKGGVGEGHAVTKQHKPHPGSKGSSQSPSQRKEAQSKGKTSPNGGGLADGQPKGSDGGDNGEGGSSVPGDPGSPPPPKSPGSSTEDEPESPSGGGGGGNGGSNEGGNGNGGSNNGGGNNNVPPVIKLPPTPLDPVVEGVGSTVNEAVNGVTGTTNEVTGKLPVQVEVPKVCVLKPC